MVRAWGARHLNAFVMGDRVVHGDYTFIPMNVIS
jgi:hypothetical protein